MVHTDAVIVFCDDVIKLLELGNIPKAKIAITALMEQAEKEKLGKTKVYKIQPLNPHTVDSLTDMILVSKEFREKLNELIHYVNRRKF